MQSVSLLRGCYCNNRPRQGTKEMQTVFLTTQSLCNCQKYHSTVKVLVGLFNKKSGLLKDCNKLLPLCKSTYIESVLIMCWELKLHNHNVCDFGTSSKHWRIHTSGRPIVSNNRFQQVNEKSLPFDLILSIPVSTFFSPTKFPHAWKAGHFLSLGCDFIALFREKAASQQWFSLSH